ncbi:homoserine kinase [Austwickia chelonae]|uniref:Homoserine kinase n=1 Tax=Austwickia chelonae NBRC 105200 TaxID=1184607 RepID=K6VMX7_9MICO|nr:homoserine kinase [Austwickia chelonae]GAB76730.1 homoserine kinase [Austwickia chelonae NBRC 105200]SEW29865.1 homoserine kinase [Austwickia chelonae]
MTTSLDGLRVRVRVPASSANLGPGFDSVGLALGVWDEAEVMVGGEGLRIRVDGEGADQVPVDERHLVYRCLALGLLELGCSPAPGMELSCLNRIPHSRGMGSSATAAVTGFTLASALYVASSESVPEGELPVDRDFVNEMAARVEGHPDNSSASVFGGMTVSWAEGASGIGFSTARIPVHEDVVPVVLVPDVELSTAAARAALPTEVSLRAAAATAGRAALLVEAMSRRPDLLMAATCEWLHQEQRRIAYPSTMRVVDALRAAGFAAVVSGAGPTVMVLTTRDCSAQAEACATTVCAESPGHWQVLTPGVPVGGAEAALAGRGYPAGA